MEKHNHRHAFHANWQCLLYNNFGGQLFKRSADRLSVCLSVGRSAPLYKPKIRPLNCPHLQHRPLFESFRFLVFGIACNSPNLAMSCSVSAIFFGPGLCLLRNVLGTLSHAGNDFSIGSILKYYL